MSSSAPKFYDQQNHSSFLDRLLLPTALIIYSFVLGLYQWERAALSNVDYWLHMGVSERFNANVLATYIDGFYPIGYPILLKFGMLAGVDMLRYGQIISWAGGLFFIIAAYYILKQLLLPNYIIALGLGALLSSSFFMGLAAREGNDALALGLQIASLMLLFRFLQKSKQPNLIVLVTSAITLALAYLTRYTALVFVPVMISAIVFSAKPVPTKFKLTSIFSGVFVLFTAIQWIPSFIETGNPIYNTQAKNVWFGIYGNGDWVTNWKGSSDHVSLGSIISNDPTLFFQNWITESFEALGQSLYLPFGGFIVWVVLVAILIFWKRPARHVILILTVLIIMAVASSAATSMAWFDYRFIAPQLVAETFLFVWCLSHLIEIISQSYPKSLTVSLLSLGALVWVIILNFSPITKWYASPVSRWPVEANALLKNMGMIDGRAVVTNNDYFHDSDTPNRVRYNLSSYAIHAPQTFDELLDFAPNARFIALDFVGGSGNYHQLKGGNGVPLERMTPIYAKDNFEVFCVLPCNQPNQQAVDVNFNDEIQLDSLTVYPAEDFIGIYFYWTALQDVAASYKMSIRLLDENNNIVLQRDNQPQLWFRPTSTWRANDQIVDFHYLELGDGYECVNCTLQLVVYDELTQEPMVITSPTDSANQVGFQIESLD